MRPVRIGTPEEFERACGEREFEGRMELTGGRAVCLSVRPHGIFVSREDAGNGKRSLSFMGRLPKIPASLLFEIIAFFRLDLDREAAVRVCFDERKREYFFVRAGGSFDSVSARYDFGESAAVLMEDGIFCVMDLHSHNRMNAFWSGTDDADELACPGALFGVIGRLDEDLPSVLLRAVHRGCETALKVSDLFETKKFD